MDQYINQGRQYQTASQLDLACARMHEWVETCMCMCVYVCVYVCMCVCVYVCMCVCVYVCMYECIYVCMYVCMYICMYVCMYVCMYEHIFQRVSKIFLCDSAPSRILFTRRTRLFNKGCLANVSIYCTRFVTQLYPFI